jgi:hypothetical protein
MNTTVQSFILKIKIFLEKRKIKKLQARIIERKKKEEEMKAFDKELNLRKEQAKINAALNV